MSELNPNHPTTRALHDHWHKIAAFLLQKLGGHAVITMEDVDSFPLDCGITAQELADGIHVDVVSMEEAERLARKEGGLPV